MLWKVLRVLMCSGDLMSGPGLWLQERYQHGRYSYCAICSALNMEDMTFRELPGRSST